MCKTLTISVAAYNVSNTICEVLDSILQCSLHDQIEVLVVNDGSTDSTCDTVKPYTIEYPETIKLINKDNEGYGSTVNTAIALATGKYFKLVDGDDWVDAEGLTQLIRFLESHVVDMVVTKYVQVDPRTRNETLVEGNYPYTGKILTFDDNCSYGVVPMHQLTFRTEVLRASDTKLMHGVPYTDAEFCIMPIPCVETISYVDIIVYRYRLGYNEQSVSTTSWQKNLDKGIRVTVDMIQFYNKILMIPNRVTTQKQEYIRKQIVSSIINKYLIFLTYRSSKEVKAKLVSFDESMREYGDGWRDEASATNLAVKMLMKSDFRLYGVLSLIYRLKLKHAGRI